MASKLDISLKPGSADAQHGGSLASPISPALVSPLTALPPTSTFSQEWRAGPHDTSFYVRTYVADSARATLVFVHGFIEHIARYEHVFPRWQKRGINVFAFDLRGFGRTALDKQRSKDSRYGKTTGPMQIEDVAWAVGQARDIFGSETPVFVLGHSMGGGIVLDFAMHLGAAPSVSGVIASSPLLLQTSAAPKIVRWVGEKVSHLTPFSLIPAPVKAEDMSRDPDVAAAYLNDSLVVRKGSLRGISDMLNRGELILAEYYKLWPRDLPLLIVHGTEDKVTSHAASQRLYASLCASDKHISLYEGGFHELCNEPSPTKENFIDECIAWVEARVPAASYAIPDSLPSKL